MTIRNILMTAPVRLGETELTGQVLVICTDEFRVDAPSRKNPNYKLNFPVFIDRSDAPAAARGGRPEEDTVNWLLPGHRVLGGRLLSAFVVLEFEPDTLPTPDGGPS